MAGLYDDAGIVVDPVTGQIISAPQTNAPGGGVGGALSGLRGALFPPGPAAAMPAPPQAPMAPVGPPQGPPPVPPDAHDQLAAIGLPPSGQPAPGAVQGAQEGLPPGAAQVNAGAPPVPPIPPPQPPLAAPQAQDQAQPQAPPQAPPTDQQNDPLAGISNNRRNNPLNLRFAKQDGAANDGGFAAFATPADGIAAAKNQFAINAGRGINTLTGLISSWAPPNENDTAAYITNVSKATGIPPNAPIDLKDPGVQAKLIPAMSLMENGPVGRGGAQSQVASGGPSAPGQMTLASTSTPAPRTPQDPLQADLQRPLNTALPYPNAARPQAGNGLLALASGLLSGPTYGAGMGKGLQAYLGQQQQDRQAQMGANNEFMQMQRLGLDTDYKRLMAGNAITKTGIQAAPKPFGSPTIVKDDQGNEQVMQPMRDGAGNVTNVPLPGMTPAGMRAAQGAQRLALGQQALNLKNDPTQLARLTAEKVAATSAQKDQDAVYSAQPQEQQALQELNQTQALIGQHPDLMGSTLKNKWSQFTASIGLSGEAADFDALQKMTTDQRNKALNGLTNGHVGGIRSNAELTNLSKAFANVNVQPEAANYILDGIKTQLQANSAWRDELTRRQAEDPDSIAGRSYNSTKSQFFTQWGKDHPLPDYQSPSGTSSPAPSAASGASPSGTAPGVSRVLRYDTKGNLVQ